MQKQLKQKYPDWVNEKGNYDLCLSDDLDSLLSCLYLEKLFGYKVKYFYTFHDLYYIPNMPKAETICIDIAVEEGKTWDNHVVKVLETDIVNPESANINAVNGVHKDNYYTKYAGSTLLQILSYYDVPLPENEEVLLILIAIDSAFMGHYNKNYNVIHRQHLEELELHKLIDILDKYDSPDIFYEIKNKYNLNGKINIENGKLETTINLAAMQGFFDFRLSLPVDKFDHKKKFSFTGRHPATISKPKVFSFALTGRNEFKFTTL